MQNLPFWFNVLPSVLNTAVPNTNGDGNDDDDGDGDSSRG